MKNTDLHTHSHYSDGQLSPKELVQLAKRKGIKNLALTDHNTVKGIDEAIKEGKKIGVNIIPGIEMRTDAGEILGYFIDCKNRELLKKLKQIGTAVENRTKEWCREMRKAGYKISFSEIEKRFPQAKGNVNEFYVIRMLYLKGYGEMQEIPRQLRKKKLMKGRKKMFSSKITNIQAIRLIKKAGGVPVWAHPWIGKTENNFKRMGSFVKAGLAGIEIDNGDRPKRIMKKKIKAVAKKYNLVVTNGSDFHGEEIVKQMPGDHRLGKNNCDEKVVERLRQLSKYKSDFHQCTSLVAN